MNKKSGSLIAVYAIVLVIWSVIFWGIPFSRNASTMISYIFSVIAVIYGLGIIFYSFSKGNDIKSKIYGFPIFRIGAAYTAAQIIFTLIIAITGFFTTVPAWIVWVVSTIFAGLATIGVIAADNAHDIIETQEREIAEKTTVIKYFRLSIDDIIMSSKDMQLKRSLEKLSEEIKYSDPVSSDELEKIENEIKVEINILADMVIAGDVGAEEKIYEILALIRSRNNRCKALKK